MADPKTINGRMAMVMEYYNLNFNSLANRMGIGNSTIMAKTIKDESRKPSYPTIVRFLKSFPKINCAWLVMGYGQMFGEQEENLPDESERVAYLINKYGITARELANKINVPITEVTNVLSKVQKPDMRFLSSIASEFPDVSPNWLFVNEGKFYRNPEK